MKKMFLFIFLVALGYTTLAQYTQKRIDSLMNYYDQSFNFNGVAFVSVKGETLLKHAYGYKDRYRNVKNDVQGIFQIGSNTKQFTAEIILMLAKEKKLDLQDKLVKFFPEYLSDNRITIENLLTHTSGIYNYTEDTMWKKHPTTVVSHQQMLDVFKDKPLAFEPGSKFDYSNSNYILLTYIIEEVTGKPYTVVARERILTPLGMTHSGFDFTHLNSPDKVTGYNYVLIDSFYADTIIDSTQALGAGAMYSTVDDIYKWHRALQSYQLLDTEWQRKAYSPFKSNYGYGLFISDNVAGKKMYVHSGRINGFSTYFLRIEKDDVCIVLLTNIMFNSVDNNALAINLVKCLYDSSFHIPAIRKEIALTKDVMQRYEGEYVLLADTSITIKFRVKNDMFLYQLTGQPENRIFPQLKNLFFAKSANAQFEFVVDEKQGYKMILHQHGQKFKAIRKM